MHSMQIQRRVRLLRYGLQCLSEGTPLPERVGDRTDRYGDTGGEHRYDRNQSDVCHLLISSFVRTGGGLGDSFGTYGGG